MLISVNDRYLEFNDDIEVERSSKLFESVTETQGDFSYTFEIPNTSENRDILGLANLLSISNTVVKNSIISNNSGIQIYRGSIYVDRVAENFISCTFYSGNTDWITVIGEKKLTDINFIPNSLSTSSLISGVSDNGIVWPLVDNGTISQKGSPVLHQTDFHPARLVKDIVVDIFTQSGLRVTGDIFKDPVFNALAFIHGSSNQNKEQISQRTRYLFLSMYSHTGGGGKTIPGTTYTADRNMLVDINLSFDTSATIAGLPSSEYIYINGSTRLRANAGVTIRAIPGGFRFTEHWTSVRLSPFDYFDLVIDASTSQTITNVSFDILPTDLFFSNQNYPDMLQRDFLNEALSPFNPIIDYNPNTGEVEINLFKSVKDNQAIDLSKNVSRLIETDYSEFISNYSKRNIFEWSTNDSEISEYNDQNEIPYGTGIISSENINLGEGDTTVYGSDINIPFQYINNIFDAEFSRLEIKKAVASSSLGSATFSSVSNSSGVARFNLNSSYKFRVGDPVLISDSETYDGLHVVSATPSSTTIELESLDYVGSASGKADRPKYEYSGKSYFILVARNMEVAKFSGTTPISTYVFITSGSFINLTTSGFYGYGSLIRNISGIFHSLSFGAITGHNSSLVNMLENYWDDFQSIIESGIAGRFEMFIDEKTWNDLKFKNPVKIEISKFTGVFYQNRFTGYKGGSLPVEVELLKLR